LPFRLGLTMAIKGYGPIGCLTSRIYQVNKLPAKRLIP
jgi:hypothetical protein